MNFIKKATRCADFKRLQRGQNEKKRYDDFGNQLFEEENITVFAKGRQKNHIFGEFEITGLN